MAKNYYFFLTVNNVNKAPYFLGSFTPQTVRVGESTTYFLVTYKDDDVADTHTETITLDGGGSLPGFFSISGYSLIIAPDLSS